RQVRGGGYRTDLPGRYCFYLHAKTIEHAVLSCGAAQGPCAGEAQTGVVERGSERTDGVATVRFSYQEVDRCNSGNGRVEPGAHYYRDAVHHDDAVSGKWRGDCHRAGGDAGGSIEFGIGRPTAGAAQGEPCIGDGHPESQGANAGGRGNGGTN